MALKWQVYKNGEFEYVKEIEGKDDVQVLKSEGTLTCLKGEKDIDLMGKAILKVTMDKPEIEEVLKATINIHKKEVKLVEDKLYVGFYCNINILYKARDTKELYVLEDDVYLSKEEELPGITQDMTAVLDLKVKDCSYELDRDDLGECRLVNVEFLIRGKVRVYSKEVIEKLKDTYSNSMNLDIVTETKTFGDVLGIANTNVMVKDSIKLSDENVNVERVIVSYGTPMVLETTSQGERIKVEGIIKLSIIYKAAGEEIVYGIMHEDIPFTAELDIRGYKNDSKAVVKVNLESLDTAVEGNNISIRANVAVEVKAMSNRTMDCVIDLLEGEPKDGEKKSSVTIYVVGENDTLWDLAKKYNTTVEELRRLNDLDENYEVKTGNKLIILGRAVF